MPDTYPLVTINSRKFDQSIRRSWTCHLLEVRGDQHIFEGVFESSIEHDDLGTIIAGTVSIEHYWLNRWYNVFRFNLQDGSLRNYYCNINMPPVFSGTSLDYVDLDIDVLIWPDGSFRVLDRAEFEQNAAMFCYPQYVKDSAFDALAQLISHIERGKLPSGDQVSTT